MTRISSAGGLLRRVRSRAGIWLAALALATLIPGLGHAALRAVTVRWNPSTSEGVVSYVLGVGTSYRSYTSQITLTNPSVFDEVWSRIVQLDDSADQHLALRAVGADGQYSNYSNEIVIEGSGGGDPDPGFGVTSLQGIPAVASGEIFAEALVDSGTESVEFRLDGVFFRIENAAPYGFNSDDGPGALIGWDTGSVADGFHTISATGYSQDDAGGEMGRTVTVSFEVSNGEPLGTPGKPVLVTD